MKENPQVREKRLTLRAFSRGGLLNAARKAVWGCRTAVRNFRKRHTPAIVREYRMLAAEKGSLLARKQLLERMKDNLLRPLRRLVVKARMRKGGEMPLVSFILPVYNVEPYLPQALDSLLAQTMKHIEIICVDDGSTDNSLEILRGYEEKDPRVKVFTQKNQYAGVARNHGLSKATGEYVCFLDSDDFFAENLAAEAYFAAKVERADLVLFDAAIYNNITKEYEQVGGLLNKRCAPEKQPFNRNDCPNTLFQITSPCPWNKLFRKQFLLDTELQFQNLRNTNDVLFVRSAMAMAERIVTLDKVLVNYRVGMTTNLQATKEKNPLCFYEAYAALHDKLKALGFLDLLRRSYVNTVLTSCLYNLDTLEGPEIKQMVGQFLRTRGFQELELIGYEENYYYISRYYRQMQEILNGAMDPAVCSKERSSL